MSFWVSHVYATGLFLFSFSNRVVSCCFYIFLVVPARDDSLHHRSSGWAAAGGIRAVVICDKRMRYGRYRQHASGWSLGTECSLGWQHQVRWVGKQCLDLLRFVETEYSLERGGMLSFGKGRRESFVWRLGVQRRLRDMGHMGHMASDRKGRRSEWPCLHL